MESAVIFVGPSIEITSAKRILPLADYRGPIRRGDLDALPDGSIVGIIDGVFDQELSVSPREIRTSLARGLVIFGSSSMGALRAAEVREIIAVGKIAHLARTGMLERDDEVALLFDADTHRALTEPLVNIRYAVESLIKTDTISSSVGKRIVEVAEALHFTDRTYANIFRRAGIHGLSDAPRLIEALKSLDLKQEDAHLLLEKISDYGRVPQKAGRSGVAKATDASSSSGLDEYSDHFDAAKLVPRAEGVQGVLVWEYGDAVDFAQLILFLKVTNRFLPYARNALCRFSLQGNALRSKRPRRKKRAAPTAQELFDELVIEWGWTTSEETRVTLTDLGLGLDDVGERLHEEADAREVVLAIGAENTAEFRSAFRVELLINDLGLKREALRWGSIRRLAAIGTTAGGEPTDLELREAKRALLNSAGSLNWKALLKENGVLEKDAVAIVRELAFARRAGVPTLDVLLRSERPPFEPRLAVLPTQPKATGDGEHALADAEALTLARSLGETIGVTRIAQIGTLERFELHVAQAFRSSPWSTTVGSGKSLTEAGAIIGAVMEEVEKYCQEKYDAPERTVGCYDDLAASGSVVDPTTLALPYDTAYASGTSLEWSIAIDLATGQDCLLPVACVVMGRQKHDVLYSERSGRKQFDSNGLASGFSLANAISHAIAEVVERHAARMADVVISNPGNVGSNVFAFVDLTTLKPSTRFIVERIEANGYFVRIMNITSEVHIPTFAVRMYQYTPLEGLDGKYCSGRAAHPNPEVAINRALLEAVQTRVGVVAGSREDLAIRARSLGRHERPRPLSKGDAFWVSEFAPVCDFGAIRGLVALDVAMDVAWMLEQLLDAGVSRVLMVNMTRAEVAPGHVVRILIPGLESINPFHTGVRARVTALSDLMRRHNINQTSARLTLGVPTTYRGSDWLASS